MKPHLTALVSLGIATAVFAGPASAATQYQLNPGPGFTDGDLIGSINFSGSPPISLGSVYIGPLVMQVVPQPVTSSGFAQTVYCTDIFNDFAGGGLYTLSATSLKSQIMAQSGASSVDAAIKASQINALLNNAPLPITQDIGAAIQAAIWEIENETGTTTYSLSTGRFLASVGSDPGGQFASDANQYLTNVTNGAWLSNSSDPVWQYVVADGQNPNQNFGFLASSGGGNNLPLPEPASFGILGLGLVGLAALRRRKA